MANTVVLLLILTYCTGYFLLASKAHFSLPVVAIFATVSLTSATTGFLLQRSISPATLLAYGLTFTLGNLLAALMLFVLLGGGRTLSEMG